MSFEQHYQETFSQVNVSEETKMVVLNMKKKENDRIHFGTRRATVVLAAVILLMAMTITAFASEEIDGWVKRILQTYQGELSREQGGYLSINEKVILQSKTVDGWTFEVDSAITDGDVGYIVVDLKAPEGISTQHCQFANFSMKPGMAEFLICPENVSRYRSTGCVLVDDGDGRDDTKRFVIFLDPDEADSIIDPFGPDAEYQIHLENVSWSNNTRDDVIVQGVWDFTVTFSEEGDAPQQAVELLTEPVTVTAYIEAVEGTQWIERESPVLLTSVEMRNLTVTLSYADCGGIPDFTWDGECPVVVLKDGTSIELMSWGETEGGYETLVAKAPIVLEQVDYIQLLDGTVIPMPDTTE